MYKPATKGESDRPSPYTTPDNEGLKRGERRDCELCGEDRRCFERFGMMACQSCQETFLPSRGMLL